MTRSHPRTSLACAALLLVALHQQQPPLSAARDAADDLTLPAHLAETGLFGAGPLVVRKGVSPLDGMLCKVSVEGYFVAPAALLLSPAH